MGRQDILATAPDGVGPVSRRSGSARSRLARRRRALTVVITSTVLVGCAGVGATAVIKSPAQVVAETTAPPPDVLTAEVEHRVLSETLVTRGTVTASQTVEVSPGAPSGPEVSRAVITKMMVESGDEPDFGQVLAEVSGRPVFVLEGPLPAYRDLRPGSRGEDVVQLQRALTALGHPVDDATGVFGVGTERAVTTFYRSIGYEPVPAPAWPAPGTEDPAPSSDRPGDGPDGKAESGGRAEPAGVTVPASEVVYLDSLPARVEMAEARVGGEAGGRLMTLSAGALRVQGAVAAHEREMIRPDQTVRIFSEVTGKEATGKVVGVTKSLGAAGGEEGQAPSEEHMVEVRPDKPLARDFAGQNVRLTIAAASSDGEVTVVPASAISAGADGRTTLTIREPSGKHRRVEVRPGMTGDGYVQVTPVGSGRLAAGEKAVVGTDAHGGGGTR